MVINFIAFSTFTYNGQKCQICMSQEYLLCHFLTIVSAGRKGVSLPILSHLVIYQVKFVVVIITLAYQLITLDLEMTKYNLTFKSWWAILLGRKKTDSCIFAENLPWFAYARLEELAWVNSRIINNLLLRSFTLASTTLVPDSFLVWVPLHSSCLK